MSLSRRWKKVWMSCSCLQSFPKGQTCPCSIYLHYTQPNYIYKRENKMRVEIRQFSLDSSSFDSSFPLSNLKWKEKWRNTNVYYMLFLDEVSTHNKTQPIVYSCFSFTTTSSSWWNLMSQFSDVIPLPMNITQYIHSIQEFDNKQADDHEWSEPSIWKFQSMYNKASTKLWEKR